MWLIRIRIRQNWRIKTTIGLKRDKIKKLKRNLKRAQSTIEYAVVIACVAGALIAMQIYIKRAMQGRFRQAADEIGEHYSPGHITADITATITTNSPQEMKSELVHLRDKQGQLLYKYDTVNEIYLPVYGIKTTVEMNETTTRGGSEKLGQYEETLFE